MQVTKTIICDLTGFRPQPVEVAQNDRNSRRVACRLRANGESWTVPEGVEVLVSYTLPGGAPGLYADPTSVIEGDTVTVSLSEQLLSEPGAAEAAVVLEKDGARLATFPFRVHVIGSNSLTNAETYPVLGAEFEGKLLFGGPGGKVIPLAVEELKALLGGWTPETPEGVVTAQADGSGALRVYLDGVEVVPVVDDAGDLTWPGLELVVDEAGDATLKVKEA